MFEKLLYFCGVKLVSNNHNFSTMNSYADKETISKMIRNNQNVQSFISEPNGSMHINFHGQPIVIFKEGIGASYFFKLPYSKDVDYRGIKSFMKVCVDCIGELIEEKQEKDICYNPEEKHFIK